MRPVHFDGPAGDLSPMRRHLPQTQVSSLSSNLLDNPEGKFDVARPSGHTDCHGQRTTTALDSAKSRAVWQPIRAAVQAPPVSSGTSSNVNHPDEKEISMGLCPITEYASAWVADPETGLFHDASRALCSGCLGGEPGLLALTPCVGSTDPTHGFTPCARCFAPAAHRSNLEVQSD